MNKGDVDRIFEDFGGLAGVTRLLKGAAWRSGWKLPVGPLDPLAMPRLFEGRKERGVVANVTADGRLAMPPLFEEGRR